MNPGSRERNQTREMLHLKLMFCGHKLLEQEQPETIDLQKTTQALL